MRQGNDFTREEKNIISYSGVMIVFKILFWISCGYELFVFIFYRVGSSGSKDYISDFIVFLILSIPFFVFSFLAFRRELFWNRDKKRRYIEKVLAKRSKTNQVNSYISANDLVYGSNNSYSYVIDNSVSLRSVTANTETLVIQGDYAKTLFLWKHRNPSQVKPASAYASFLKDECGIKNPVAYHMNLINEGFFVDDGTNNGIYVLSPKGEAYLEEHNDYIELYKHKKWGINWQEYKAYASSGDDFLSVVQKLIKKKISESPIYEKRDYYLVLYDVLKEKGNMSDALETLIRVVYLDVNGSTLINEYNEYRNGLIPRVQFEQLLVNNVRVYPDIMQRFKEYIAVYDSDIIEMMYKWKLPIQICNMILFKTIIESGVYDNYNIDYINGLLMTESKSFLDRVY